MFDEELRADLRRAVQQFRAQERRRLFQPVLHIGRLPGAAVTWRQEPRDRLDAGLRTDVAGALFDRFLHEDGGTSPDVWLTRQGEPDIHDDDLAWSGPIEAGLAAAGIVPRCVVVVTKTGWHDPRGAQSARWKRPRRRGR